MSNLATRGQTGTGNSVLTAGFVIGPGANKQVIVRAIGPSLSAFGLTGLLADPVLTIFNAAGTVVATNDNWLAADAAAQASVGAFALPAGSKDSVVVTTLAPGNYSAQVSGGSGLALVEIYEVGGTGTKLLNISTRGVVGTGASQMFPGIVVSPGTGTRKFLVRAAGPALGAFGLPGTLADPTIVVTNSTNTLTYASNNDWGTPVGFGAATSDQLAAAFTANGAFAFAPGSKDAALIVDLAAGNYSIQVSGVGGTSGLALVEIYDITPAALPAVTVAATIASADKSGSKPGEYTVTRSGSTTAALTVNYSMSGSAVNGFTYSPLIGSIVIPAGAASVKIPLVPLPAVQNFNGQTAVITLTAPNNNTYTVGDASSATVTIADSAPLLFVSNLRPEATVSGSSVTGTASILVNQAGTIASVSVSFSGLSSSLTGAHLRISPSGDFVFNLPVGQASNVLWNIQPTGTYSAADLFNALKSGNIYVGLDTANNPSGEGKGVFIASSTQTFSIPAAPPALPSGPPTAADAARFLTQATFGPLRTEIATVQSQGYDAWITAQLALPFTSHRTATVADFRTFGGGGNGLFSPSNRQAAWFKIAVTAPDQLRQRVALALSEIFVVSDAAFAEDMTEPLANYYDLLGKASAGNFRTLLGDVTSSPVMGLYLSSLRSSKADPVAGTYPDENYAREVMQLFTVGLNLLQPDGTLKLDQTQLPLPTYNQNIVSEMAKVFTGYGYSSTLTNPSFRSGASDLYNPMQLFPANHDDTQKSILNGVVLPAGQGGVKDMQQTLDALFQHPNTPPFIAKQMIQRLVTSNPTPAYVYRVAQKFIDNGSGVRGDIGAVVRAILTDYEARTSTNLTVASFGKLKEPLIRTTALLRTFGGAPASGRYVSNLTSTQTPLAQAPLRAPTVFNFFHPDYVLPGPLAAAGLVAPEYEITDATYSISVPNFLRTFIFNAAGSNADSVVLDLTYEASLASTPAALLDHLNLVMCGGNMPQATRDRVTTMLGALSTSTSAVERAQRAILVISASPAGAIQK